jgi:chromatin segregation and condensation protein Rec8/ScpA/Scc1 (kleisin family)
MALLDEPRTAGGMAQAAPGRVGEILDLIPKDNSWEQILYQVVAMNNLDPWDLDLNALSKGFSGYISSLDDVDFRVPAKWVIISAVLLRMKSDHIKILKMDSEPQDEFMGMDELDALGGGAEDFIGDRKISREDLIPMDAAPRRMPVRRVTITELVDSLRKVLTSEERRGAAVRERMERVSISTEDITARIEGLYKRITGMLGRMDDRELKFSELVGKWEKANVVDHFMPLIHLDNEKKIACRQKEMFSEILIKGRKGG